MEHVFEVETAKREDPRLFADFATYMRVAIHSHYPNSLLNCRIICSCVLQLSHNGITSLRSIRWCKGSCQKIISELENMKNSEP